MTTEVTALDARMTRLEDQATAGFNRIETLIRQEINDLKTEQINDLRKANDRLSDDQRRLWDRVNDLERRENVRVGEKRSMGRAANFLSATLGAGFGALVSWLTAWLSNGAPPHH